MTTDPAPQQPNASEPAPVSPQPTAEDASRREQAKAQIQTAVENLKAELATRLDQFLDELGALI
jgi:hypothetical protein